MIRELVAKNIFVFTSELYAQVTAGAILTPAGAIVIDTLPFPTETRQIVRFVEERHGLSVRFVVNTHYHADHTYGTCLFDDARVVSHALCRELLDGPGRDALIAAKRTSRELAPVTVRLPDIVFEEGHAQLHLGGVTLRMWRSPGHSPDSIVCLVEEEQILFAADTMMPVPFFADGSWQDYVTSLESLRGGEYETIVQGHGEVILRGEVESRIEDDLAYLHTVYARVEEVVENGGGPEALDKIDIEECGKNRIALNGIVQQLHRSNVEALYQSMLKQRELD
jgi:cyclase